MWHDKNTKNILLIFTLILYNTFWYTLPTNNTTTPRNIAESLSRKLFYAFVLLLVFRSSSNSNIDDNDYLADHKQQQHQASSLMEFGMFTSKLQGNARVFGWNVLLEENAKEAHHFFATFYIIMPCLMCLHTIFFLFFSPFCNFTPLLPSPSVCKRSEEKRKKIYYTLVIFCLYIVEINGMYNKMNIISPKINNAEARNTFLLLFFYIIILLFSLHARATEDVCLFKRKTSLSSSSLFPYLHGGTHTLLY